MTTNDDKFDYPSSNSLAFYHSTTSILAQFKLLMQDRFSQGNTPWEYSDIPEERSLHISTELNEEEDIENEDPAIIVGRGTVVWKDVVQASRNKGNDTQLRYGTKKYFGKLETDITLNCVSTAKGTSSLISDVVQGTIAAGQQPIKRYLGIHDIGPVLQQRTQPYESDTSKYTTPVQFRIKYEQTWKHLQSGPEFNQYSLNLKTKDSPVEQDVIEKIFYSG